MELSSFNEDNLLDYWNNWLPSSIHSQGETCLVFKNRVSKKFTENIFSSSKLTFRLSFAENSKFGNWIPPIQFFNTEFRTGEKRLPLSKQKSINGETCFYKSSEFDEKIQKFLERSNSYSRIFEWKKELNLDWGRRVELHDIKFKDGDTVWNIVNLGIFANIKIWVNDYGNICGLAEGKISKLYSSETTYICITKVQLIRKMLCLSGVQWASICDSLQETKITLKFDAFQDNKLTGKSTLEKLWILVCKRRHFLPDQCMLVKLCGAIKCMRKFQIIPKLSVQDVRSISGEPLV